MMESTSSSSLSSGDGQPGANRRTSLNEEGLARREPLDGDSSEESLSSTSESDPEPENWMEDDPPLPANADSLSAQDLVARVGGSDQVGLEVFLNGRTPVGEAYKSVGLKLDKVQLMEMEHLEFAVDIDSVIAMTRKLDLERAEMSVVLSSAHDDFSGLHMTIARRTEEGRSILVPMRKLHRVHLLNLCRHHHAEQRLYVVYPRVNRLCGVPLEEEKYRLLSRVLFPAVKEVCLGLLEGGAALFAQFPDPATSWANRVDELGRRTTRTVAMPNAASGPMAEQLCRLLDMEEAIDSEREYFFVIVGMDLKNSDIRRQVTVDQTLSVEALRTGGFWESFQQVTGIGRSVLPGIFREGEPYPMHASATSPPRTFPVDVPEFLSVDVALTAHPAFSRGEEQENIFWSRDVIEEVEEHLNRKIGRRELDTFCLTHDIAGFRKELGVGVRIAGFPAVYIQVSCLGTVSAIGKWALKIQIAVLLGVPHKPRGDGWKRNKFFP